MGDGAASVEASAGREGGPAVWLSARGAAAQATIAAVSGASLSLGHAPVDFPWVAFLALPLLVWLVDAAPTWRRAAVLGWAAGFGFFVATLHWVGHAFVVDAERFAWLLPFAVTLLPAGLGLFWAAAFGLARRIWSGRVWWRAGVLATTLAGAEMLRGHILTGFPWALPAYAWVETPIAQAASWAGPYGLSFIVLALAGLPLTAVQMPWGRIAAAGALAGVAALWAAGAARMPDALPAENAEGPVIRIVQPNAAQHLKWDPDHAPGFLRRLVTGAAQAPTAGLGPPDAVVWPETAITFLPQDQPELLAQISELTDGRPVITGALFYRQAEGQRHWSNSLIAIGPGGEIAIRYDKHHLVPFGEYLPLRSLLERIGLSAIAGMAGAGFEAGAGPRVLEIAGLPPLAPAICYEMIFPGQIVPAGGPRPGAILHLTNDAWFGAFAGPQQHLAQARMRAIEQGLPVIRAANTGISAMIDAYGRLVVQIPLDEAGTIDARLPASLSPTLYARGGDLPVICMLLAALLCVMFTQSFPKPD